jgi:hypothetical protein
MEKSNQIIRNFSEAEKINIFWRKAKYRHSGRRQFSRRETQTGSVCCRSNIKTDAEEFSLFSSIFILNLQSSGLIVSDVKNQNPYQFSKEYESKRASYSSSV